MKSSASESKPFPKIVLSPLRVSPFLAWGDFHARSRFARSTIPKEKWGTTRSLGYAKRTAAPFQIETGVPN